MKIKLLLASALFAINANQISAQYLSTSVFPGATGVSNSGKVVGYNAFAGPIFFWNPEEKTVENIGGVAPGNGYGGVYVFSGDGNYISGSAFNSQGNGKLAEMSRYNVSTKTWQNLGSTGVALDPNSLSSGYYISEDGKNVVGLSFNSNGNKKAIGFLWNEEKGPIELKSNNISKDARANAVSGDGAIIVGWQDIGGPWKSSVWKRNADGSYDANKMLLVNPNGSPTDYYNQLGEIRAISENGKWLGGKSDPAFPAAWIWSEETGVINLGSLFPEPAYTSMVSAINNDGSIVLGFQMKQNGTSLPFIWTKTGGIKNLNDFVQNDLGFNLNGDKIAAPTMMSSNGKYIVGWSFPSINTDPNKSFRIQLPDSFLAAQNIAVKNDVKLYPNPVTEVLSIETKDKVESVKIYNGAGQLVNQSKVDANKKINVTSLTTGVYNVNVTTDKGSQTYKVIKK